MAPSTLAKFQPLPLGLVLALQLLHYPTQSVSYSWKFKETPKQCGTVTIDITGNDGRPPYRALVVPDGPNPLSGNEVRTIMDIPFDANATSVSFKLKYPANGRLVTVISDASGFGTGGTSVSASVADSDDDSCFDPNAVNNLPFVFDIQPRGQITQCADTRFFIPDPSSTQGNPTYHGIIPGGNAFEIPQGPITDVPSFGRGFTWKCNLRAATQLLVVGGDNRGISSGGSINLVVAYPSNGDASCLDRNSPSSTPGTPAGGTYPTGTGTDPGNSDGSGGGSSSGNNTGAIVGGVVGGLVALAAAFLLIFFYRRRKKHQLRQREKPIDLNEGDDEGGDGDGSHDRLSRNNLPEFYRPEPFTVPDPTVASSHGEYTDADDSARPLSGTATSFYTRSGTPDGSVALGYGVGNATPSSTNATGRKGQPPRMRPVNIIQHDDAGPSAPFNPAQDEEPETVELPPAYTAIQSRKAPEPSGDAPPPAAAK